MSKVLLLLLLVAGSANALAGDFTTCLGKLRRDAMANGIAKQTFDTAMTGVEPDQSVLDAMDNQPEFKTPVWDYLASLVDEERIADGQTKLAQWAAVLADAERRFGVDRHILVAVWGVESDFGRVMGKRPLVRSLATGSCFGGRQKFFRGELLATMRILQSGDMRPEVLVGSWAGAFGQTQFMPSTYQRLAVDLDGDGRRDIVGSVPDALASAANYLKDAGWVSGQPWGYEVGLPANYRGPSGRRTRQALAHWDRLGIRRVDGTALSGNTAAALLLPSGAGDQRSSCSGTSTRFIRTTLRSLRSRSRTSPTAAAAAVRNSVANGRSWPVARRKRSCRTAMSADSMPAKQMA